MLAGQVLRDLLAVNREGVSLLLVEELAEGLPQQVVDLPVAEKGIVGAHQLQLLLVVTEVLLCPLVADSLADHRQVEAVDLGGEVGLRVGGEDGAAGVVLLGVDGGGEGDLDGANGVVFWYF